MKAISQKVDRFTGVMISLLLISLLSGCGFKLRGTEGLHVTEAINIDGLIEGSPLYRAFERHFGKDDEQGARLLVIEHNLRHRRLSLSASTGIQLYNSKLSITASFYTTGGEVVWLDMPFNIEREYSFDSTNPVGLNDFQQQISQQIMDDVASVIGRRIAHSSKRSPAQ